MVVAQAGIHRLEGVVGGKFATRKCILAGSILADVDKTPLKSSNGSRGELELQSVREVVERIDGLTVKG